MGERDPSEGTCSSSGRRDGGGRKHGHPQQRSNLPGAAQEAPMIASETAFYVTGGTLRSDASSYVERQADRDLHPALTRGEFCYVLASANGFPCVFRGISVPLSEIGA